MNRVQLGDRCYFIDKRASTVAGLTEALVRTKYEIGHALCLCSDQPLKLQIRPSPSGRGDLYFLAVWPKQREAHDLACRFARGRGKSASHLSITAPAVSLKAGHFHINPGYSLMLAIDSEGMAGGDVRGAPQGDGTLFNVQAKLGLLGTLQFLWESSGLNRHEPGSSLRWNEVQRRLVASAAQGYCAGRPLTSVLHVIPAFDSSWKQQIEYEWAEMLGRHRRVRERVPLFLVLGEVRSKQDGVLPLLQLRHSNKRFHLSPRLSSALDARYPSERSSLLNLHDDTSRVIGLFLVEARSDEAAWVHDAALMLASRDYIPADSSWEAKLANHLVTMGRRFYKPMKSALGEARPDFILTDTAPETIMEVFGMQTPEYLERKNEKIALYGRSKQPFWQWSPQSCRFIPPVPPSM